ncbi:Smr/MutS family protein [Candidatus Pelagibacter sp.]|uniref:Smr/MutS family protein n=1 Tax=Candidatus Pelagibacter sp. TaxID=2024849 RepID=UPI003F8275DF
MTNNISDKDQKDWKNFLEKNEKLTNKDLEKEEVKSHITKSLDLHGYTLDEANKKVENFITDCFDQKVSKIIIVTGKGLHSQNDKDPYISKKFGILKNSVPDFIKNNSSLMKKIKNITDAEIKDGGSGAFYVFLKKKL